ncbi:(S)-ureidoglycine aminohydrolase, cupin domain [Dillenia turbinata]|uniref:(S)-ureidoglycine aminohydrolase, cupin domain n=1 Tax=Dillenia turbinata TaxID=194707 RepID=A0AAN8VSR1_9MAGN
MGRSIMYQYQALLVVPLFAAAVFLIFNSTTRPKFEPNPLMETEIFGVKIHKNPPQSKLDQLGVTTWKTYEGQPSKFPWFFDATETMYILEGKVKVTVDGHEGSFEIGGGDLVVFPKGMKITWDIIEPVKKHYHLEKENND